MKKSRFTKSQIVAILKEADAGVPVNEVWRKHGISSATYYKWKAKYGGLDVSELKRTKELEAENAKLKRMFADLAMENRALKDLIQKSCNAFRKTGGGSVLDEIHAMPIRGQRSGSGLAFCLADIKPLRRTFEQYKLFLLTLNLPLPHVERLVCLDPREGLGSGLAMKHPG
jgi:putative transposase